MGLSRAQLITIITLMSGTFLVILNQTLLTPVLPVLMTTFGIEATTVQWLTSAYSLVMAIIIPLSPYLLGKFGSRKVFIAGMAIFFVGSSVAALAPSFWVLLLGRIFQALAVGVVMPMSFTIVLLEFPREQRGSAMGLVILVIGFAPAIGPTLSGLLVDSLGWRALFGIVAVLALVIFVVSNIVLKNNEFEETTFDIPSIIMSSIGLVCLLYGLSSFASSENQILTLCLIVVGVVVLCLFVVRQFKLEVPFLRVSVLKTKRYRTGVIVTMFDIGISTGMSVLLPLYVQNLLGYSAFQTGLIILPGALLGAIVGLFAGRIFDKHGIRVTALPGSILLAGALIVATFVYKQGTPVALVSLIYAVMFIGLQLLNTTIGTWGLNSLDNKLIQHAQAVGNTLNQVSASFLTAVIISITALAASMSGFEPGSAQALEVGYHFGFVAIACVSCATLFMVVFFVRNTSPSQATASASAQSGKASVAEFAEREAALIAEAGEDGLRYVAGSMNRDPYKVHETDTIASVVRILVAKKTGGVSVVDDAGKVVGFISDGDIMKYLAAEDANLLDASLMIYHFTDPEDMSARVRSLMNMEVQSIMTRNVISLTEDISLGRACKIMVDKRLKKLPVVDEEGYLVGSLSRADVVRSTLSNMVEDAYSN